MPFVPPVTTAILSFKFTIDFNYDFNFLIRSYLVPSLMMVDFRIVRHDDNGAIAIHRLVYLPKGCFYLYKRLTVKQKSCFKILPFSLFRKIPFRWVFLQKFFPQNRDASV
jgi:hypothetical protein